MDEVEILHTDAETYVPLLYEIGQRFKDEERLPEGIPLTFAEGLPCAFSRPGRALAGLLNWVHEEFPQAALVRMISEGLLEFPGRESKEINFSQLAGLLRPLAIGLDRENYLPKLDEQIDGLKKQIAKRPTGDDDDADAKREATKRRLAALRVLKRGISRLLDLARPVETDDGETILEAAEKFLESAARSVNELDEYAVEALVEEVQHTRLWLDRLGGQGSGLDLAQWLQDLPGQTRILGRGPRAGHIHVTHVTAGGHSGRPNTFVIGLDDSRFPGAGLQDPILLDRERSRLSEELPTSSGLLRERLDDFSGLVSRLSGQVTLSWPCLDVKDDRDVFPSPLVLSAFRIATGDPGGDLAALNEHAGPPVSFAPEAPEKALDESERWLWRLCNVENGRFAYKDVLSRFPHLAQGHEAQESRESDKFSAFNGFVPAAGEDLNPGRDSARPLSASSLETAGRCPLAFFFQKGLGIEPPEEFEVDLDRWLSPLDFGSLLHEVFRRFMRELAGKEQLPDFERDHHRLAEHLKAEVDLYRKDFPPPNEHAYRAQYWQLAQVARVFLQAEEEFCRSSRPAYFEVALGMPPEAEGSPLDEPEPVRITLSSGLKLRARGKIDRIDIIGGSPQQGYSIWDYKTGSAYGYSQSDPFNQGRVIQNLLYSLMVDEVLRRKLSPKERVQSFGYFFPGVKAMGERITWPIDELREGEVTLEAVCQLIARGAFPATDNYKDCTFCDYAGICDDVQHVASLSKALAQRDDIPVLQPFRELRGHAK